MPRKTPEAFKTKRQRTAETDHRPRSREEQRKENIRGLRQIVTRRLQAILNGNALPQPAHSSPDFMDVCSEEETTTVEIALGQTREKEIASLTGALESFEQGTYGDCVECGKHITLERLRAVLGTTTCAECQGKIENGK